MSVVAARGFVAGGVACGIKGGEALDLAVVAAGRVVPAAGVFTTSTTAARPFSFRGTILRMGLLG